MITKLSSLNDIANEFGVPLTTAKNISYVMYKHGKERNRSYALAFRIKFETYLCMNCMLESVTRQSRVIGYVGNVIRIEGNGNFLHVVCRIITALVSQV